MKNLVLFLGFMLMCTVACAQANRGDSHAAERASAGRKPAGAGVAIRAVGHVIGKAILNNKIGKEQPLPRQSRPKQPIERVLNPSKSSSRSKSSSKSKRSSRYQERGPGGCSRC